MTKRAAESGMVSGAAHDDLAGEGQDIDDLFAQLEREGFLILRRAIEASTIAAIAHDLEPHFEKTPRCEGDFYGWETTRLGALLSKAPMTRALVMHRYCLGLARRVLSPLCDCIQLNLTQAIRVHPGERAQAPHRDEEMWPCGQKSGHWLLNVMWPLSPFTAQNGATRLWPQSHRAQLQRNADVDCSLAAEANPGDAIVFLGSLTHAAGANASEAARTGIIVSYCLGWLKQYENQYLAYPREVAASFDEPLLRLLGYQLHRPNLGGVAGDDPILIFKDAPTRPFKDALTPEIARELSALYSGQSAGEGDIGR